MRPEMFGRLPLTSILASWLQHLPSFIGLILAALLHETHPDLWLGRWAGSIVMVLLLLRIGLPIATWATFRFASSPDHVAVRTGLLINRVRTTTWMSITVTEVNRPWAYRALGLSVVVLHAGGEDGTRLTFAGVDRETATILSKQNDAAKVELVTTDSDFCKVIYRATLSELLISSAAYGQFILLGAGASAAAYDALSTLGIDDKAIVLIEATPALSISVVFAIFIGTGFLLTLLRYYGFVVRSKGGRIVISQGLFSKRERVLDVGSIVGGRVQRNLVEMIFDRARVSLRSTDTARQVTPNLVLPSLPRSTVRRILAESFPEFEASRLIKSSGYASIARACVIIGLVTSLSVGNVIVCITLPLPLGVSLLFGAVGLVVLLALVRIGSARLRLHDSLVLRSSRSMVDRDDMVHVRAVHVVSALGFGKMCCALIRVHFFAGIPRSLMAFATDTTVAVATAALLPQVSSVIRRGDGSAS